ncbi:hypothetical protein [Palleronia sp.]|uniref:hypothetical protein n=1 Tax=Palleronia sp. TaxID=1940284 RepID=UPI0035C86B26
MLENAASEADETRRSWLRTWLWLPDISIARVNGRGDRSLGLQGRRNTVLALDRVAGAASGEVYVEEVKTAESDGAG